MHTEYFNNINYVQNILFEIMNSYHYNNKAKLQFDKTFIEQRNKTKRIEIAYYSMKNTKFLVLNKALFQYTKDNLSILELTLSKNSGKTDLLLCFEDLDYISYSNKFNILNPYSWKAAYVILNYQIIPCFMIL